MNQPPITTHEPRESNNEQRTTNREDDDELSLLDLMIVLAKYKKLILGLPFIVAVAVAGYSLTLNNIYTATVQILPPQQSQSPTSAIMAQLGGGIAGLLGGGAQSSSDVYVAMLRSRTLADNLNKRLGLTKFFDIDVRYTSDLYKELEGSTKIIAGKEGIIAINVDSKDPKFAADLANAYAEELINFTNVLAVTVASQRRLFYERQFALATENLSNAEFAARQALQTSGLVAVDAQGRAMVENIARLRAQITVREVQIGAMRTFATDSNPDLQRAQREVESMKRELAKLEGTGGRKVVTAGANGASAQGAESLRLLRDVKYNEVVFELLGKQYEMAKLDESKDSSVIQIMDKAVEPDRRSKPKRTVMVLLWTMAATFFSIMLAFVLENYTKGIGDPKYAARLQELKRYLAWR